MINYDTDVVATFQGADGSFLLKSLPGKTSEKDSRSQEGMRNEKYVDDIKAAVDKACGPNIVSCADILAVSAAAGCEVVCASNHSAKLVTGTNHLCG